MESELFTETDNANSINIKQKNHNKWSFYSQNPKNSKNREGQLGFI